MELDDIDLNVDNYSQEDLLALLNLNDDEPVTYNYIVNASKPLINRYTKEDNYNLANFFQQLQNKLLEDIDYDENDNIQDVATSQLGSLWQNQNVSQEESDLNQANKVTDRKQKIEIFNQGEHFVMNRNQLGVNNNYQLPVAQGQMNPNIKNTTSRLVNIDSQYREDISPFLPDPDGPT